MKIDSICALLIDFLRENHFSEGTIHNYQCVINRFNNFCKIYNTNDYLPEIGHLFANDVISKKSKNISPQRYHLHNRFIRVLNSYFYKGYFDLSIQKRGKREPEHPIHLQLFKEYELFLNDKYKVKTTIDAYSRGAYYFLQFLNSINQFDIKKITTNEVFLYIKSLKPIQQKDNLNRLRNFLRFIKRNDLLLSLEGLHIANYNKIIPMLTEKEKQNLKKVLSTNKLSARDSSIIKLGFYIGIRAIDVINLKLSDIDWDMETISFIQSKTGNPVTFPLITDIGNSIVEYLTKERPKVDSPFLFLSTVPPFTHLCSSSACYAITQKAFKLANINKPGQIFGMHMLRHNAASSMVQSEVPIETISAILGHSNPNSTGIYITTDDKKLKECVLPMKLTSPEGAL